MTKTRIVIMAKAPMAGFAKTRLIPALGEEGAANLARQLLLTTVESSFDAKIGEVALCVVPSRNHSAWQSVVMDEHILQSEKLHWSKQCEGDLGERMANACEGFLCAGEHVLLIGADCPSLTPEVLQCAASALLDFDAVVVPAHDGGYTLLGLKKFDPSLFKNIAWSSAKVLSQTLACLQLLRWQTYQMSPLNDIDVPEDLYYLPKSWPGHKSKN